MMPELKQNKVEGQENGISSSMYFGNWYSRYNYYFGNGSYQDYYIMA